MLGAASLYLPLDEAILLRHIELMFSRKGHAVVQVNLKAFGDGRALLKQ